MLIRIEIGHFGTETRGLSSVHLVARPSEIFRHVQKVGQIPAKVPTETHVASEKTDQMILERVRVSEQMLDCGFTDHFR